MRDFSSHYPTFFLILPIENEDHRDGKILRSIFVIVYYKAARYSIVCTILCVVVLETKNSAREATQAHRTM